MLEKLVCQNVFRSEWRYVDQDNQILWTNAIKEGIYKRSNKNWKAQVNAIAGKVLREFVGVSCFCVKSGSMKY